MVKRLLNFWAMHQKAVAGAAIFIAVIFPLIFASNTYVMNIAVLSLIYAILALSLNLVTGFLGTTTLGHAAFFGIGAYSAAILSTKLDAPFLVTLIMSALITAFFGLLLGLITLRVNGRYLSIVTLGFCEIARLIELNWYSLTRGPLGIMNIPAPEIFGWKLNTIKAKYFIVLILLVLITIVVSRIIHSRIGRAVGAIKCDDLAAGVMGINVKNIKIMVFIVSSAIAGMAGGFYAHYISFIDPTTFNYNKSVQIMSMAILGGMGSIPGSIIGAIVLTVIPELLRNFLLLRQVIYGVVIIVIVMFKPAGLLGGFNLRHIAQQLKFQKELSKGGVKNE